jgi:signal transduction histidine kinase
MSLSDPTVPRPEPAAHLAGHAVQFYETDEFLCDVVGRYAAEGLSSGQAVLLIATAEHVHGIGARLSASGHDVAAMTTAGRLVILDAGELLSRFMVGPLVDEPKCRETLEGVLATTGRAPVRAFGEMVDLLWRRGDTVAALRVEEIWSELTERYPLSLVCGYAMSNFGQSDHERAFLSICGHHARVLPAEGYADLGVVDRDREFNRLRQRAHALEREVERRSALEHALRDALTARRRSEDELRRAKEAAERAREVAERASSAKSEFLAVMSHELRTPLNAIFGYEDLLRSELGGPLTERQVEYLDRLRSSTDQLLGLVNQVLQLSRIEAGREDLELAPCSPAELVCEAMQSVEPAAAERELTLRLCDHSGGIELRTDVGKLRQIVLNLLSNAVKFTEAGTVETVLRTGAGRLLIDVSDSGIGIDPDRLAHIFEPFVQGDATMTRRYGGTGLGLSVSRNLARLLGGEITVVSTKGEGSTFTVSLPLD